VRTRRRSTQHGVAAIEFAIVFTVLFVALYGIATFGAVLYTQQVVSRAAEEGARAAPMRPRLVLPSDQAEAIAEIRRLVHQAMADSLVVPAGNAATPTTRLAWVSANVTVSVVTAIPFVTVTVSYPYGAFPMLPSLPLLAPWMPVHLTSRAVASIHS
jgi:Flp pilus assembly protein TadG